MKYLKRLGSLLLAGAMTLSLAVPALAAGAREIPPSGNFDDAEVKGTITLDRTVKGEKYDLYRIFDLSYSNKGDDLTVAYRINDDWIGFFNSDEGKDYIADAQEDTESGEKTDYATVTVNVSADAYVGNTESGEKQTKYIAVTEDNVAGFAQAALKWAAKHADASEDGYVPVVQTAVGAEDKDQTIVSGLTLGTYLVYPRGASVIQDGVDNPDAPKEDQIAWASICSLTSTTPEVEISIKSARPVIDKKIDDALRDRGLVEENTASIGEAVSYVVTSTVPSMVGYEDGTYIFIMRDTLSKGLTFNDDVKIFIGADKKLVSGGTLDGTEDAPDASGSDYYVRVSRNADGTTDLAIVFTNFKKWNAYTPAGGTEPQNYTGEEIKVTYSATVNQDAKVGTDANTNTVYLEYSNDPRTDVDKKPGSPDEPKDPKDPDDPDSPTGTSPKIKTYTYVTGVQIEKVDDNKDNPKPLSGAQFLISGQHVSAVMVNGTIFKKASEADGTHWRLKDGTYTTQAPPSEDDPDYESKIQRYESTTQRYVEVKVVNKGEMFTEDLQKPDTLKPVPYEAKGLVDEKTGCLTFVGLGVGEYEITELVAPNGYNLLTKPVKLVITAAFGTEAAGDGAEKKPGITWTVTQQIGDDADTKETIKNPTSITVPDGSGTKVIPVYAFKVVNQSGTLLPSTGGIGPVLFFTVGGILALGAALLLIRKMRRRRYA